jgi:hypothetical protein
MNEMAGHCASPGGLHDDHRSWAAAEGPLNFYWRAGRSSAKAVAGSIAAVMLSGCPIGGEGGGPPVGTIGAAMSAKNIEARNEMLAQRRQEQIAIADARQLQRQQQRLEAQRAVQAASDRLVLKAEQEKAQRLAQEQRQRQIAQQQQQPQRDTGGGGGGNNGRGNQGQGNGQGNQGQGQGNR